MSSKFLEVDINAKLPIIRVDEQPQFLNNNGGGGNNNNNNHNSDHNHSHIINNNNNHTLSINPSNLKKPSFREVNNYHYRRKAVAKRRQSYFRYTEPTPEELMERIEYDMDEEDTEWLTKFNRKLQSQYNYSITENDFEKIMDRLEKESFFESSRSGKDLCPEVDDDAVCAICNDGDCHNANQILFCDMCDLAVHQECYGVPYIPEGQWLCRRCLQSPSRNVDCVLCPNKGGAFKQTDDNRWAHVICALWIPEVCFANTVFLEPIDNISNIPSARWKLVCYICKQKKVGACIQCHKTNCYVPFHVTCAQQAGLYMKISTCKYDTPEGPMNDVKKEAFCDQHGPSDHNGGGMYDGEESDVDYTQDPAYKIWKSKKRENMKNTRKILAEKRQVAFNPIAEPVVKDDKILEISQLLTIRGKNKPSKELRQDSISNIKGYWLIKRTARSGVPLLRRLQVSYSNNAKAKSSSSIDVDQDKEAYTRLRYDLEKARLLIGEVRKRETRKKKLHELNSKIMDLKFQIIDLEKPPIQG